MYVLATLSADLLQTFTPVHLLREPRRQLLRRKPTQGCQQPKAALAAAWLHFRVSSLPNCLTSPYPQHHPRTPDDASSRGNRDTMISHIGKLQRQKYRKLQPTATWSKEQKNAIQSLCIVKVWPTFTLSQTTLLELSHACSDTYSFRYLVSYPLSWIDASPMAHS